jgi:xanthine dehydrogenase accessory factor
VRAALDVPDELRERLHTPAGLAIGARTPAEIALSILAEIVQERRADVPQLAPVHAHHHCHDD